MTMVYWKAEAFWLGKLLEHPEIMSQGRSLRELEDNLREAYLLLVMDGVPDHHRRRTITIWGI
jgi:predicted RNase H-like HicB family nuclease